MVTSMAANNVYPSGGILATRAAAMAVLAPGWFSITTGWPHTSLNRCASTRARMSVGPPGGNGTMIRTVRLGYVWLSSLRWAIAPAVASKPMSAAANRAPKQPTKRTVNRDTTSSESIDADQSYFIPVSFTTTDQRCASLRMKAENSAGVLVAGNRPEASGFALMTGSARILATSACNLSMMAGGVPLGATRPSQTVISSIFGSSAVMIGRSGTGGNGRGSNLASTRNAPLWMSESEADGPSKEKSTLLVSTACATSALPL